MPNLPGVSGRKAVKALERLGIVFVRQKGSHVMLRRGNRGCVVPMHREINPWTRRVCSSRPASKPGSFSPL